MGQDTESDPQAISLCNVVLHQVVNTHSILFDDSSLSSTIALSLPFPLREELADMTVTWQQFSLARVFYLDILNDHASSKC